MYKPNYHIPIIHRHTHSLSSTLPIAIGRKMFLTTVLSVIHNHLSIVTFYN